jgi:NitT/TauT family transport system permease protein
METDETRSTAAKARPPRTGSISVSTPTGISVAELESRGRKRRRRADTVALGSQLLIVLAVLLGMYWLNAVSGKLVMPRPDDVLKQSIKLWSDGTMIKALGESLTVLSIGFAISAVTGIALGVFLGGFRFVARIVDPFVNALNSTPGAAFIPLIIVWFGLYTEAKVVLVWNAAFFPILINTTAGIANANRELVEMGTAFGANRRQLFLNVMLPDALPSILSGLRIGAAISTVGTVIAELTMAQSGLGGLLAQAGNRFQMDKYFAVVIVLMVLGTVITGALRFVESRVGRWRTS